MAAVSCRAQVSRVCASFIPLSSPCLMRTLSDSLFDVSIYFTLEFGAHVFPMPQAMKILDAIAAVDEEWKTLETIPAWSLDKETKTLCKIVGHMTLQDCVVGATITEVQRKSRAWWHCKRRFWRLRTFLSNARFLTAAKAKDVTARLPNCDGQAAGAVSAYTQVKRKTVPRLLKILKSEFPDVWMRLPRNRNLYGHPVAGLLLKRQFEEALFELALEKVPKWECFSFIANKGCFCQCMWMTLIWLERSSKMAPMWKNPMKNIIGEATSFLDHV